MKDVVDSDIFCGPRCVCTNSLNLQQAIVGNYTNTEYKLLPIIDKIWF